MSASSENWSAYWATRTEGSSLEGVGVENSALIDAYWDQTFEGAEKETSVIDLACGAGTVIKRAQKAGLTQLTALDYSQQALAVLRSSLQGVATIESSLTADDIKGAPFDLVVSQFGVEYAGQDGFAAAARLVAPQGRIVLLCHQSGGGIDEEVTADLAFADGVKATRYIEVAKEFAGREHRNQMLDQNTEHYKALRASSLELTELAKPQSDSIAHHLLQGFGQLIERRFAYDLNDIIGWIDGMERELNSYRGRMAAMVGAALDEANLETIRSSWDAEGLAGFSVEPFPQSGESFAWAITAHRP